MKVFTGRKYSFVFTVQVDCEAKETGEIDLDEFRREFLNAMRRLVDQNLPGLRVIMIVPEES